MDKLKKVVAALALAGALVMPVSALADTSRHVTYKTSLQDTTPLALQGFYPGTLRLTESSDGIVQGWYLSDNAGSPIDVYGSDNHGNYWLSFGNGNFEIHAVKQRDGTLVGSAERVMSLGSTYPQTFSFTATPASS